MLLKQMIELFELLDDPAANGETVAAYLKSLCEDAEITTYPLRGEKGITHMVKA